MYYCNMNIHCNIKVLITEKITDIFFHIVMWNEMYYKKNVGHGIGFIHR